MDENEAINIISPELDSLMSPLSCEEVTRILAKVCIAFDDQRSPQEIATDLILQGSITQ